MAAIACTKCKTLLPESAYVFPEMSACPKCETGIAVAAFPALLKSIERGRDARQLLVDSESSCFYHANKKAAVLCDACGRFLCALCDLEIDNRHLCPTCLETGKRESTLKSVENRRTLHDGIALSLALAPLIIFWLTILTAPITIGYAIYAWNKPSSIVRRARIRLVLAIVIALLEIAGWAVVLTALLMG